MRGNMRFLLETTDGLKRRLKITVPADNVDQQVKKRLQKIKGRIRVDGFRAGKVPFNIIMQSQHAVTARAQVVDEVMQSSYSDALKENDLKPAGQGDADITTNEQGKDLEFTVNFEVYPEISLQDLSTIEIEKPETEITENDVDKMIEHLRQQQQKWVDTDEDTGAEAEHAVVINCNATVDGEEPIEEYCFDNKPVLMKSDMIAPGFYENLKGAKAGETRTFNLVFPDDFGAVKGLQGKCGAFTVTVQKIQKSEIPELNEEFFKLYGIEEGNGETFRTEVKNNMERELKYIINNTVYGQIWKHLLQMHPTSLPEKLVQAESQRLCEQHKMNWRYQPLNAKKNNEDLSATDFVKDAEKALHLNLIINEVVSTHNLKLDNNRVAEKITQIAASYENSEAFRQFCEQNNNMLTEIKNRVITEQVAEFILEKAQVKTKECSYEEAILFM